MARMEVQDPDALFQTYTRGLYRITGQEEENSIMDMMSVDQNADNSRNVVIAASDLGGGVGNSDTQQASGAASFSGKLTFTDTTPGYWLGTDPKDGIAKFAIGSSTKYITWDGTTLTVVGGVSISSLDIPDVTTANSFHVDSLGNAWWGQNTAAGFSGAPASITKAGAATFSNVTITGGTLSINGGTASIDATGAVVMKNIQIGGSSIQYQILNSGILSFGDGSDGAATLNGSNTFAWAYAGVTVTLAFSGGNFGNGNTLDFTINGQTFSIKWNSILNTQGQVKTGATLALSVTNLLGILQSPSGNTATYQGYDAASGQAALLLAFTWTQSSNTITGVANSAIAQQFSTGGSIGATLATTVTFGGTQGNHYWLSRDVYLTDLTISTGITLHPNGYRIFGNGTLTMTGTGTIDRSGLQGYAQQPFGGNPTAGGLGGGSLSDGYLKGSQAGTAGGASGGGAIASVPALANSIGVAGVGVNGGTDATVTASNVRLIANWHLATLLDIGSTGSTVKFTGSNSSAGGGSGSGTGGGGGASAGAIVAIYFRKIIIGSSAVISSNGGQGGDGTNQSGLGGGISGNGNGGSGGVLVIVYNSLTNNGNNTTTGLIANAGLSGSGGNPGTAGNAGVIYQFQISL